MAKRSTIQSDDFTGLKLEIEEVTVLEYAVLRCVIPSRVTWHSPQTGETYVWERGGAEVKVRKEDIGFLLEHKRGGCCGEAPYASFELVE